MGSFAEMLLEATQQAAHGERPSSRAFADAVRVFEDGLARAAGIPAQSNEQTSARPSGSLGIKIAR